MHSWIKCSNTFGLVCEWSAKKYLITTSHLPKLNMSDFLGALLVGVGGAISTSQWGPNVTSPSVAIVVVDAHVVIVAADHWVVVDVVVVIVVLIILPVVIVSVFGGRRASTRAGQPQTGPGRLRRTRDEL